MRRLFLGLLISVLGTSPLAAATDEGDFFVREGLRVEFDIAPSNDDRSSLYSEDIAEITLRISDAETGQPVSGLYPAAWIDPAYEEDLSTPEAATRQCRQKASTYLSGYVGIRPMIDLNSYYLVVMNHDATIGVIDPIIGVRGITKLLTQIVLPGRGEDWTTSEDEETLFVVMPDHDAVGVIDLKTFKYVQSIRTGARPDRIARQPDGRYLWVGYTGRGSGVSVLDAVTREPVTTIATGSGHHEITFNADSSLAFVSNNRDRTVSVIDVAELRVIETVRMEGNPISLTYSGLSDLVYVADGVTGQLMSINPETRTTRTLDLEPGLGPMATTPDERYIFITNTLDSTVSIIDTATNQRVHQIDIEGKPFHLSFSRSYAYVRSLEIPEVSLIRLNSIGESGAPITQTIKVGERAPSESPRLSPAGLFAPAVTEAANLIVSPGDATVYYYMEGMNAPMGSFRNYGHRPISAIVTDRTIKEEEPGLYRSRFKVPSSGFFQFIMTMDAPQIIECFQFAAETDPEADSDALPVDLQYLMGSGQRFPTGAPIPVQFSLSEPDGSARAQPYSVEALSYRAPGEARTRLPVRHVSDDIYEVEIMPDQEGVYYIYLSVPEAGLQFSMLPYLSVFVRD